MRKFLHLSFLPRNVDPALLVLRVWFGLMLFGLHGMDKMARFSEMSGHFPDPLHIGSTASLACTVFAEVVCSLLVAFGLFTRLAALVIVFQLAVAFTLVHHFQLKGQGNGELALAYMGPFVAILLSGAGRFSVDNGLLKAEAKR